MKHFLSATVLLFSSFWVVACDAAEAVRVCTDDLPHPPYLMFDREGSLQILLRMAAKQSGLELDVKALPAARCRESVMQGQVDMAVGASYIETNFRFGQFPMKAGKPDVSLAAVTIPVVVIRRRGSAVKWNGQRFSNLAQPVLIQAGQVSVTDMAQRANVEFDAGVRKPEQMISKLLAGRGDAILMFQAEATQYAQDPAFADKIEILPQPFGEQNYYYMFSRAFHASRRADAEEFWRAVGQVKKSPEYLKALRELH